MANTLKLVSGIAGSGKTTYCSKFDYPLIHIDDIYVYDGRESFYGIIEKWVDENKQHDILMLDAYVFGLDTDLSKLKKAIFPIENIEGVVLYTTIRELWHCQRSTPARRHRKKAHDWSKERDIQHQRDQQKVFMDRFTGWVNLGIISSVEYLFRQGDNYIVKDKEHFLDTLTEPAPKEGEKLCVE